VDGLGEDETLGDLLVDGIIAMAEVQAVGAGQIHHLEEGLAVMAVAGLFLHRHPRPVAHLLAGAGEGVEQGRFAAVGVADEGQGKGAVHSSSTSMAPASWRRRLRWKPRTRI